MQFILAGLFAGYASWLTLRGGIPWAFGDNFLSTLLNCGIFSSIFLGLMVALPPLLNEFQPRKALHLFAPAAATGLALPMTTAVIFSWIGDMIDITRIMPYYLHRSVWWLVFSFSIAASRAILVGNRESFPRNLLGLIPGILLPGLLSDAFFAPRGNFFWGSMILGISTGAGLAMSLELLKDAWLEEFSSSPLHAQYLLESDEFVAGSSEDCDLTLSAYSSHSFSIVEKDGLHVLEAIDEYPVIINNGRFKYRILVEGDAIRIDNKTWIYHSRYARTRDAMPEAATY